MEWHDGKPKPECDTFGPAMPHINLGDVRKLERLAWAVYDGMYVPGSRPALSGPCNWVCILNKKMTHIFHGRTLWEHYPPSTIGGANTATAARLKGGPSSEAVWEKEPAKETPSTVAPAFPASKTPTLWSIVNVPSGAASAHAGSGAMTVLIDLGEKEDEEPFHEFNQLRMQQCGVGKPSEHS